MWRSMFLSSACCVKSLSTVCHVILLVSVSSRGPCVPPATTSTGGTVPLVEKHCPKSLFGAGGGGSVQPPS